MASKMVEVLKTLMKVKNTRKENLISNESGYDLEVSKTEGNFLTDSSGKKYIDLTMGWCVGNLGWGMNEIEKAIENFKGPHYIYPGFKYKPWEKLADLLTSVTPGDLTKVYRTSGGTESVDTAMQIAMACTGRTKFVSVEGSYHGNSIATLSIGDSENREKFKGLLPGCDKIDPPLDEKALKKVETRLKKRDVAAFVMEPVILNLAIHIPAEEFMRGLNALCKKYGTLLVIDEVATGFGRTGKMFATEYYDIKPDVLCLAKAISGGYAGLGAVLTTEKIYQKVKDKVNIYSTYGWHPLSVETALANINYILKHKQKLLNNVAKASQQFRTALSGMGFKNKGKLNIIGLAIAVDLKKDSYAEEIRQKCKKNGLLLISQDKYLIMYPALNIDEKVIGKAMNILKESL
jgi:adenosylmethionine-8-amino-7-oxononanoate aminotransferase